MDDDKQLKPEQEQIVWVYAKEDYVTPDDIMQIESGDNDEI